MRFQISPDRAVEIAACLAESLCEYAQNAHDALEAGGLLLGELSDDNRHLTLCDLTEPMPNDRRTRFGFERNDPGHQAVVKASWDESGGKVAAWGTWHTHAEPTPMPSALDIESWAADLNEWGNAGDCLFHIIVGTEGIGLWTVSKHDNGQAPREVGRVDLVECKSCGRSAMITTMRSVTMHDGEHYLVCRNCQMRDE